MMQLTDSQIMYFRTNGFLAVDREIFTQAELDAVRVRIDALYGNRMRLPKRRTKLAVEADGSTSQICEILGAAVLDPGLARLDVVSRCRTMAEDLLGQRRVWLHFDHVFYKDSGDNSAIPWHQDSAYSATKMTSRAVHFWIPLQDVDATNGCMNYVPGTHLNGLRKHKVDDRHDGLAFRSVDIDESEAVACPVHAGGMVCHAPMTMHGSGPNLSGDLRRAWVLQFGLGPWPALRETGRPLMTAGARVRMAAGRVRA